MIKDMGRIAVIHRGEWGEGSSYDRLDVVSCGGSSYMCVSPTAERPPSASWKVVALKGDAFAYSDFTEEQIAGLMRPATAAAKRADDAIGRVEEEHGRLELLRQSYADSELEISNKFEQAKQESADAVERSKTAAANAEDAAKKATDAATKADTAAGKATDAAGLADTAKTNANTAAGEARSAATKAETAARKADGAAETAGTAASTAEGAAKKADTAAGKADSMAERAEASAEKADIATGKANEATVAATNAATKANEVEAKLTGNILKGKTKDTFVHVDDAFPSSLLGIEIEGATEQVTTTGKNLLDCHKLAEILSEYYAVEKGNIKAIKSCNLAWSNVPALITLDAGTYYSSGDKTLEIRKASDNSKLLYGEGKFTLNQTTEIKIKAGTGLPSYPVVIKAQIEKGSTATAYETYTGGKPSPSPDFPQEIKVVENPTIKINGRNLLDFSFPAYYAAYASSVAYIKSDGKTAMLPFTTSINSANGFGFVVKLKAGGTYTLKTFNATSKAVVCIAFYSDISRIYSAANKITYVKEKPLTEPISFSVQEGAEYAVICFAAEWGNGKTQITYPENFKVQVEISDNVTDYTPYLRAEQVFTLPTEHPYLAKIGNVADEIKVDKDGNASLIARISKTLPSNNELSWGAGTDTDSAYASYKVDGIANKNGICSNRYIASNWTNKSGCVYCPNGTDIAIRDNRFTSREKAVELLKGVVVYVETNEKTYSLGKINLPALPESVSNVWTDAEITPRTTIEYTKDVNIAIARIEDAIASIG